MKNSKKALFKYTFGVLLITVLIIIIQIKIISSLYNYIVRYILLLFSVIVIPIVCLYFLQKYTLKKEDPDSPISKYLAKIFSINMIITLIATFFLVYKLPIVFNTQNHILVLPDYGLANAKIFKDYEINFFIYSNLQYVIKCFILSTIYISFLTFILLRYWICKNNKIKNKKIHFPLIVIIFIGIELLSLLAVNIKQGQLEIPISKHIISSQISNSELKEIENELDKIDQIISYEYISSDETLKNILNNINGQDLYNDYESSNFPSLATYKIIIHYKDLDIVQQKLNSISSLE